MTRFKLNTWDPYIIKQPIPSLETKNSPIITPIKDMLTLIFRALMILEKELGTISLK